MEIAYRFKNFVVCLVSRLMFQLWSISDPPPPPAITPPSPPSLPLSPAHLDSEAQVPASSVASHARAQQNRINMPKIVLTFCFSAALDMALICSVQTRPQLPLTFHLLSLAILFAVASLFVASFIGSKFPIPAQVLEHVGVFFGATAFVLAVTIPFPLILKCTTWALFALCLLTVFICNRF